MSSEQSKSDFIPQRLGAGGVAEAWLVQDQETGKLMVSKRLICDEKLRHLVRTANQRAHALLTPLKLFNPKIQMPLEPFWADEALYEYIPGTSLEKTVPGILPLEEKIYLLKRRLLQAVDAVVELGGKGLVHCDIRPENMVLTPTGEVMLIDPDFTLEAKSYKRRQLHGPVWFTAPEVLEGKPSTSSDLFSLGVSIWTLLGADLKVLPSPLVLSEERLKEGFHSAGTAKSLRQIRPAVEAEDREFAQLLDALTEPNPADRPMLSDCIGSLREHVDEQIYMLN